MIFYSIYFIHLVFVTILGLGNRTRKGGPARGNKGTNKNDTRDFRGKTEKETRTYAKLWKEKDRLVTKRESERQTKKRKTIDVN